MGKFFVGLLCILFCQFTASGQLILKLVVQDNKTKVRLGDVDVFFVKPLDTIMKTDEQGIAIFRSFPSNEAAILFIKSGYEDQRIVVEISAYNQDTIYMLVLLLQAPIKRQVLKWRKRQNPLKMHREILIFLL